MRPINPSTSRSPPPTVSPTNVPSNGLPVPVPRSGNGNSNYTWEKPERARTSHACEPCRERKTKCDGSRPACRRCLHTGTTCYYGYGKGWRKRKTAEDLTATSRRLARYETLLNQIFPIVSPEVRALIEDARDDGSNASNASEAADNDYGAPRQNSSPVSRDLVVESFYPFLFLVILFPPSHVHQRRQAPMKHCQFPRLALLPFLPQVRRPRIQAYRHPSGFRQI